MRSRESLRGEAVYKIIHGGLGVGAGSLVGVAAAFAGKEVAQGIDTYRAAPEETGQGAGVQEVAVKPAAEGARDGRVRRLDFGHRHGLAAGGKGPGQQDPDVAPVGGGETAAASAIVVTVRGCKCHAGPVDLAQGDVRFDVSSPRRMRACPSPIYVKNVIKRRKKNVKHKKTSSAVAGEGVVHGDERRDPGAKPP